MDDDSSDSHLLEDTSETTDARSDTSGSDDDVTTLAGQQFSRTELGYRCDLCHESYPRRGDMVRHLRETHRVTSLPQHKCPICDRAMMQKSDLRRHMATHTDTKEHLCPICGKGFTRKDSMVVHKRQHSNSYKYKCTQCGRGFYSRVSLESHMRIHTGVRPFSCPTCGSTFRQKGDLTRHLQSHMGIKPYNCDVCGKTFGRNADLRRHQMTHEEEKPWRCAICNKGFSRKYLYTKHAQWHEANPGAESNNNVSASSPRDKAESVKRNGYHSNANTGCTHGNHSDDGDLTSSSAQGRHPVLQNILENKMTSDLGLSARGLPLPPGEVPGYLSNLDDVAIETACHDNSLQKLADRLKRKMEDLEQQPEVFGAEAQVRAAQNRLSRYSAEQKLNNNTRDDSAGPSRKRKCFRPTKRSLSLEMEAAESDVILDLSRVKHEPVNNNNNNNSSGGGGARGFSYPRLSSGYYGKSGCYDDDPMEPLDLSKDSRSKSAHHTASSRCHGNGKEQ